MKDYFEVDGDGRIVCTYRLTDEAFHANQHKGLHLGQVDSSKHYYPRGIVRDRPAQASTLKGTTLSDLPVPCTVLINGTPYKVDDGTAELSFSQVGNYHIVVRAWPYLDMEFDIENPAS